MPISSLVLLTRSRHRREQGYCRSLPESRSCHCQHCRSLWDKLPSIVVDHRSVQCH